MVDTTGGTKSLVFSQICDLEVGEISTGILDEISEDALVVVADKDHFTDAGNLGNSLEVVPNNGMSGNLE